MAWKCRLFLLAVTAVLLVEGNRPFEALTEDDGLLQTDSDKSLDGAAAAGQAERAAGKASVASGAKFALAAMQRKNAGNRSGSAPSAADLMKAGLPEVGDLLQRAPKKCTRLDKQYPVSSSVGNGLKYWYVTILYPGCFKEIRSSLSYSDFADSLLTSEQLGSGSGISGASHFLTKDGQFYMKTIPAKEAKVLEEGKFLRAYNYHVKEYPATLLIHLIAMIKFEQKGKYFKEDPMYILVMDNSKSGLNFKKDSYMEFDLKGSKWKHRIMKKGGRRCNPLYPMQFWKKGVEGPFQNEGEDLDFYGIRTHASRGWFEEQQELLYEAPSQAWSDIYKERLKRTPFHDSCVLAKDWVEVRESSAKKEGKKFDFCAELQTEATETRNCVEQLNISVKMDEAANPNACTSWVKKGRVDKSQQQSWDLFVREEKVMMESVREFFSYPSNPENDMAQQPLVIYPTMRERLMRQMALDVALLNKFNLMDYSMDLIIKKDPEKMTCSKLTSPCQRMSDGNPFQSYKGGIRAVGLEPGSPAESSVYIMRIMDFLSAHGFGKSVSSWAQSWVAVNKVETRLPEILSSLIGGDSGEAPVEEGQAKFEGVGQDKCSEISMISEEHFERAPVYCWTSCGSSPNCNDYRKSLSDSATTQWTHLAEFNFDKSFVDNTLACTSAKGWFGKIRGLCLATKKGNEDELKGTLDALMIPTPRHVPPRIKAMSAEEVDIELTPEVREVLSKRLKQSVNKNAPLALRHIALMSFDDFGRRPFREDTVPPKEYAQRFMRYFESWIKAPSKKSWHEQCPNPKFGLEFTPMGGSNFGWVVGEGAKPMETVYMRSDTHTDKVWEEQEEDQEEVQKSMKKQYKKEETQKAKGGARFLCPTALFLFAPLVLGLFS